MKLTRPVTGWKRLLDPVTWEGITDVLPILFPTMEGVPRHKLLNRKTKTGGPSGLHCIRVQGAAADASWVLMDGTVTIDTQTDYAAWPDQEKLFNSGVVADGHYWFIPWLAVYHDDPTSQTVRAYVVSSGFTHSVPVCSSIGSVTANTRIVIPYPIILKSGWTLSAQAGSISAGQSLRMDFALIICEEDEPIPWF